MEGRRGDIKSCGESEREVGSIKAGSGKREGKMSLEGGRRLLCGIEGRSLLFWNVTGIGRQDVSFWKFIGKWDFVCLSETWLEEKRLRKN